MAGVFHAIGSYLHEHDDDDGRLQLAVIGAGASGLVSAKYALAHPDKFIVTVYEQDSQLGGTWVYTDRTIDDEQRPVHSSMYKSLRTNLPKQTMAFLDHPFPQSVRSFLTRKDVLDYLVDYAHHFHVINVIQFNKRVLNISPLATHHQSWIIEVQDTRSKEVVRYMHDAVMVCTGHFTIPRVPDLPGLERFVGYVLHSHSYRIPEPFRGLKVVCLGAGSSGVDISMELCSVAALVYFSHNKRKPVIRAECPPNLVEIDGIVGARATGVLTRSGQWYEANAIILCTGYLYSYPFLSPECQIEVKDNRVAPLYKHLINIAYPTMALVGVPFRVCPFTTFDLQAQFFIATLTGELLLPTREQMMAEMERELEALVSAGKPMRYAHNLADRQWAYFAELANAVGTPPPSRVVQEIFKDVWYKRGSHPKSYRLAEYVVLNDEQFKEVGLSERLKG